MWGVENVLLLLTHVWELDIWLVFISIVIVGFSLKLITTVAGMYNEVKVVIGQ